MIKSALKYCRWFLNTSNENYHFSNTFFLNTSRTNIFSTIMATSTAIICIIGPRMQAHTQVKWWTFGRVILETSLLGHISLMVRSMAKSTENFFKTILSTCWKKYWNHVLILVPARRPAYTAKATKMLNKKFGNHWIDLCGPYEWTLRSPDFTLLDFFLGSSYTVNLRNPLP